MRACNQTLWMLFIAGCTATTGLVPCHAASRAPNIIVLLADDLGYGDLSCYGHPSIRTPHLDHMAGEGLRFTDFYSAAAVCTPSRAGLLTGRYPVRSGMCEMAGSRTVLFPNSKGGLPPEEVTIAKALKAAAYSTAHIGKWHLGVHSGSRPLDQGFDSSFGVPYSNDMDRRPGLPESARSRPEPPLDGWNIPLMRDGEIIERPANQATLTKRYTDEALKFIREKKAGPFFLYLAYSMPHTPLFATPQFKGHSPRGIYGDTLNEIDWSAGEILKALRAEGIAENTLVFFTSDNGPWLSEGAQGGSAGLLRDGKGSTWEGGSRVPCIAWMPGRIHPGVTSQPCSALDFFPTSLALAATPLPGGTAIDGRDLSPLLFSDQVLRPSPIFYYRGDQIFACRLGDWKAHFRTQSGTERGTSVVHAPPWLFHLPNDPSEQFNVSAEVSPSVLTEIQNAVVAHRSSFKPGKPQLD